MQIAKLRSQRDHLPDLVRVITFDGEADGEWVLSLADLQALGAKLLVENPRRGGSHASPRPVPTSWPP